MSRSTSSSQTLEGGEVPIASTTPPPDDSEEAGHSLLAGLRPPPQFSVRVHNLTIVSPPPPITIPIGVPIPLPSFLTRSMNSQARLATELVRSANLEVEPGELLAIAGGSGSGKTTLLMALCGRLGDLQAASGEVSFVPHSRSERGSGLGDGGKNVGLEDMKSLRKIVGFVRQEDCLLPYLTVRETLTFAASLRLPASVTPGEKRAIVEQTILELGLREAADVLVGGQYKKGISGGEKRRLSIGCVLVTLPSVLILDEPTTGLDSFTANQLLKTLSRLARRGRVVILSIHQPRSDAFHLFDKVTLLSSGSIVYSGFTSGILDHFREQGFTPDENTNPLDFVVDVRTRFINVHLVLTFLGNSSQVSSIDTRDDAAEERTRAQVGKLVVAWRQHELSSGQGVWKRSLGEKTVANPPEDGHFGDIERVTSSGGDLQRSGEGIVRANFTTQIRLLTKRSVLNVTRNYQQSLGFLIHIGIIIGLAFLNPPETPAGIQKDIGSRSKPLCKIPSGATELQVTLLMRLLACRYQSTPAVFYLSIIVSVWIQVGELIIFDREREDNLYSTIPYVFGSWLSYLPGNVIFPTIYAIIIYFMCGFRRDSLAVNLFSFIAQCIMQQLAAWSYATIAASLSRSFASASLLANGFSIPFILSSGYLIVDLPIWVSWTRWLSPYSRNQCVGTNVLVGLRFPLDTPLYVYPLGLLGFIVGAEIVAIAILQLYHPGGVHYAAKLTPSNVPAEDVGEKAPATDAAQAGSQPVAVEISVKGLQLSVQKRSLFRRGAPVSKVILAEVDSVFPPGQAGKSSFLQLLAGRLHSGRGSDFETRGAILLNGRQLDSSNTGLLGFVEQEDNHHLPALTVRETLRYAARLRLRGKSNDECEARAEEVLRMLGLKLCADNMVGGILLKGISGGEKRRLSLGVELLSDPSVLLADEPLSGLDAFTAQNVMQTLKDIASSGVSCFSPQLLKAFLNFIRPQRTVIVSVHQPRSDIWRLFDNVLLLAKGGRTAYSGPRSEILEFFQSAGQDCPKDFNAADFILDAISIDGRSKSAEEESGERVARILEVYKRSHLAKQRESKEIASTQQPAASAKLRSAPFHIAFPVILGRSFRLSLGPAGAQNRVGLLQEATALPFVGMLACIAIFPTERSLFYHEYRTSGRQPVEAFLLAYSVQETIATIISSGVSKGNTFNRVRRLTKIFDSDTVVFCRILGIGLRHTPRIFLEFWFSIYCIISVGESIGIVFSTFFENGGLAVSLVSAGITLMAQLNGIISVTLAEWLQVIGWGTPMKSQSYIDIINEMKGLVFECTADEISSGACIAATGQQLLDTFGITHQSTGQPKCGFLRYAVESDTLVSLGKLCGILAALTLIFRLFCIIALRIRVTSL
ncbi:hypothetical protein P7C70_g5427, partial [Phenoliferia sp. Uapishka_3]